MRLRKVKNAQENLEKSRYYISNPVSNVGNWHEYFQNNHPIHLEIGTGKGQFLIGMAKLHPEINFIGMEKYDSVLVRAIEKAEKDELSNLRFLCMDAKCLQDVFQKEISTLYLNFSDPWPKERHKKRRLTHQDFLKLYETIFIDKKTIIQKTDNEGLFAFSLEEFSKSGYTLEKVSLDLANEVIENVQTEYEEKFSKEGYTINYVKAVK